MYTLSPQVLTWTLVINTAVEDPDELVGRENVGNEQWRVIANGQTCNCLDCEQGSTEDFCTKFRRITVLHAQMQLGLVW